jgi:predicted 3-demethylubiquinone-9 3-methyltransferase (glyoxalase superfamily)
MTNTNQKIVPHLWFDKEAKEATESRNCRKHIKENKRYEKNHCTYIYHL